MKNTSASDPTIQAEERDGRLFGRWFRPWSLRIAIALALPCCFCAGMAQPATGSEERALHLARLEHWLTVAGLSDDWEIEKLRWGSDPSPAATKGSQVLRLELGFKRAGGDQPATEREFLQSFEAYQASYGDSAPGRIFYQLIHECHVALREAVVTMRVGQKDYVVFFDRSIGDLSLQSTADRSISKEVPFDLPKVAVAGGLRADLGTVANPNRQALSALIDNFLHDYLSGANQGANMPKPTFAPDDVENRDRDHIGYVISGVRGLVLTDRQNWEKLEISLDVVQAPSGMKLLCHFEGYFAPGLCCRLPADDAYEDMRKEFQGKLKTFADGMLLQLQKRIENGSR